MDIGAFAHRFVDGLGIDLSGGARQQQDLGAVGEELGRAAF